MHMPLRHEDTKSHKELIFSNILFVNGEALDEVKLGVLVPWWQNSYFFLNKIIYLKPYSYGKTNFMLRIKLRHL
jgi:hypothetical protein